MGEQVLKIESRWMDQLLKLWADSQARGRTPITAFYLTDEYRHRLRVIDGQDKVLWGLPVRAVH